MKKVKAPTISPEEYVGIITELYSEAGSPERAEQQSRYMRDRCPYYGLKAPEWLAILKVVFAEHGQYEGEELYTFVRLCFEEDYREMHYTGLQMLEKRIKTLPKEGIAFLEECVLLHSWWDTVDWLNKLIGLHFKKYPELQIPYAEKWIESDVIWFQRLAMIHQLMFRAKTDWDLMQRMILRRASSKEFFVQKAAGWSLRQYSRINGEVVRQFILEHEDELSPLTKREGMRLLNKIDN